MDYLPISKRRKSIILIITILIHALIFLLLFAALWSEQTSGLDPLDKLRHLFQQAHVLPQSPLASEQASVIFYDDPQEAAQEGAEQPPPIAPNAEPEQPSEQESEQSAQTPTALAQELLPPSPQISATPSTPRADQPGKPTQMPSSLPGSAHGVTIGDITRGFIKSMRQEHGRTAEHADSQTLARQRYTTRVWSMLKQSYRANRKPTYLLTDLTTQATLVVTIAKDGSLRSVELEHPNKTHDVYEIEQILKEAVKKAGLYPPVPGAFEADVVTLRYPMVISIHEGIHTYDFMYQ